MACYYGNIEIVKFLLTLDGDRTINIHIDDNFAFKWASDKGHLKVLTLLQSHAVK